MNDIKHDLKHPAPALTRIAEEQGEILYEASVTRNPALIDQYKLLRRKLYNIDERFIGFRIFNSIGAEEYEDPDNQMILLRNGNRCYGGLCLRISTPKRPVVLDLENDILPIPGEYYFSLRERLPEMELGKYAYAECSRMALHPALRTKEATRRVLRAVLEQCKKQRVRYLFGIGNSTRLRFYKQIWATLGQPGYIAENIDIPMRPEYEGIKMHLLCGDMRHFHVTPDDPDANSLLSPIITYDVY